MTATSSWTNVVYLFGAGASHASVDYKKCPYGILMRHLNQPMARAIHAFVTSDVGQPYRILDNLTNDLIDDNTDYEHVITFLDQSPSAVHRRFAAELRRLFEEVLRQRLSDIEIELGDDRFVLYARLLDMYNIPGCPEDLQAILTINYDDYIEAAVAAIGRSVNLAITAISALPRSDNSVPLVKLHGSFSWEDVWPVLALEDASTATPLWIPPGIHKTKTRYPFNFLWGIAHELLRCDVLRIVGCKLTGSDWDLVSLLFATRHSRPDPGRPYRVELIDSPLRAIQLRNAYPYLDVRWMIGLDGSEIGREILYDLTNGKHERPDSMSHKELEDLDKQNVNWLLLWLKKMAVSLDRLESIDSLDTPTGIFQQVLTEEQHG